MINHLHLSYAKYRLITNLINVKFIANYIKNIQTFLKYCRIINI